MTPAETQVVKHTDPQEIEAHRDGQFGQTRLRQILAHQHPVHEEFAKAYQNLGGVVALTDWAEDNKTEFYKLFAKTAPTPKEATFVQIHNQINNEGQVIEARRVEEIADPNAAIAVYQLIAKGR